MHTLFLLLLSSMSGQDTHAWDSLRSLHVGETITVVRKDFKTTTGEFTGLTDDVISLRSRRQEVGVARAEVLRVQTRNSHNRLRNALIGAGAGAGAGVALYYTVGAYLRNEGQREARQHLLWLAPLGLGFGIGAAVPSRPTLYRAP